MSLSLIDLKPNQIAIITDIISPDTQPILTNRLQSLGFVRGKRVKMIRKFWFGGLLQVQVGATGAIALRPSEGSLIKVSLTVNG